MAKSSNASLVRSKWLGINPSQLRHLVQIQKEGTAVDAAGGQSSTGWETIRSPWASITAAAKKEDYQSAQFSSQVTDIIAIRWAAAPVITPGMQVIFVDSAYTTHVYLIQAVDNVDKRNMLINLMCLEINGSQ
jgi:SPP1 family predicted phage head-tail adaptor